MFRKLKAIFLLITFVITDSLLIQTPAQAATSDCPSGATCIWRDTMAKTAGKGSAHVSFQQYIPNFGAWTYKDTKISAGNSATSFYNNGAAKAPYSDVYLYKGTEGKGDLWKAPKGTYYSNLATQTWSWNDTINSGYFHKWAPRK